MAREYLKNAKMPCIVRDSRSKYIHYFYLPKYSYYIILYWSANAVVHVWKLFIHNNNVLYVHINTLCDIVNYLYKLFDDKPKKKKCKYFVYYLVNNNFYFILFFRLTIMDAGFKEERPPHPRANANIFEILTFG